MAKKKETLESIKKKALGLIDNRQTDNDGLLIKRDRSVTMLDIFGTEQKVAVAYYVSDLLAKGFNNQQIIETVKLKYGLEWKVSHVNVIKTLLHKMWRCEIAHTMNEQIAREIATLDVQLKEAWAAWEFSKKGIRHTKTRNTNSDSPAPEMKFNVEEVIIDEDTCAGDVKFLQHINELGKERRKLLGLYAPEKKADEGIKNAVQFNIVGEGAGGEIMSLMEHIMKGAPMNAQRPQNVVVEDAQIVEEREKDDKRSNEEEIDKLMQDMFDE